MQLSTFCHPPQLPCSQTLLGLQGHWIREHLLLPFCHSALWLHDHQYPGVRILCVFGRDDAIVGSIRGTLDSLDVPVNFLAWDTLWRAHPTAPEDGVSSLHSMDS